MTPTKNDLTQFVSQIYEFTNLSLSTQIDSFAYYLTQVGNQDSFTPTEITSCFDLLNLPPHSNIPSYLNRSLKKNAKNKAKYFKKNNGYAMVPQCVADFKKTRLLLKIEKTPTDDLFPKSLFEGSRNYVKKISVEAAICYDESLFNACSVLIRRILETLIIEAFERKSIESKIKDSTGNYLFLSDLISVCTTDTDLTLSRNSKQGLSYLKNMGDLSAHSRRYLARKTDIDQKKEYMRIAFEELLQIIDYPTWK